MGMGMSRGLAGEAFTRDTPVPWIPKDSQDAKFRKYTDLTMQILDAFMPVAVRAKDCVDEIEVDDSTEVLPEEGV
jgi:hypothetical protein